MVDYALAGNTEVIVVQFLNRFGRNSREILQRYWQLEDFGVQVATTDEGKGRDLGVDQRFWDFTLGWDMAA